MGKDKYENEELLKYGFPEAGMPSLACRTYIAVDRLLCSTRIFGSTSISCLQHTCTSLGALKPLTASELAGPPCVASHLFQVSPSSAWQSGFVWGQQGPNPDKKLVVLPTHVEDCNSPTSAVSSH